MERLQLALDRIATALDRLEERAPAPAAPPRPSAPPVELVRRHAALRDVAMETLADLDRLLAEEEEAAEAAHPPRDLVPQDLEADA